MTDLIRSVYDFQDMFDNCVFSRRYVDRATDEALGGSWQGNAAITTVTGQKFNRALSLDGTGDYIDYGNLQSLDIGTEDFSVEFVVNTTDTAGVICGKRNGSGNGWIVKTSTGLDINLQIDDGTEASGNNTTVLTAGWHHVLIAVDRSGNATFYIDGSADGTLSVSGSSGTLTNTTSFIVGIDGNTSSSPLDGDISFVRLWRNKVITADEASQLATSEGFGSGTSLFQDRSNGLKMYLPLGNIQGTTITDESGNGNDGTATSLDESDVVAGYNQYRNALQFDGSVDKVDAGTSTDIMPESSDYSISFWMKPDVLFDDVMGYWDDSSNQCFFFTASDGRLFWYLRKTTNYDVNSSVGDISVNQWQHITGVIDRTANFAYLYKDGKQIGSKNISGAPSFSFTAPFEIGADIEPGAYDYDGAIQDVMIFKGVRKTPLEVEMIYKRQRRGLKL